MNATANRLLVTAVLPDRVGILRDLTGALFSLGANLTDARQAVVGGVFVFNAIAELPSPAPTPDSLAAALRAALPEGDAAALDVRPCAAHDAPPAAGGRFVVSVVGPDAPGRIHRIAKVVAAAGANVEDWRHDLSDPARTLTIGVLSVPPACDPAALRDALAAALAPDGLAVSLVHENLFRATNEVRLARFGRRPVPQRRAPVTPVEQKTAAAEFAAFWAGTGYEKGQTQPFWIGLLRLLGVDDPERGYIEFEDKAHIDATHGFIDGYVPATHVLIEQKSLGKDLRAPIRQSDGSMLSPFQQAKRYAVDLPYSRRPRWVVTCNFAEFDIYDMENPNAEPERLLLENLPRELYRLSFLVDTQSETIRREEEISKAAGDVVGAIYDALLKQYRDPTSPESLKSLNELCVRLVFLLYAEDADVIGHLQFHDYLKRREARDARRALIELFKVLDTPPEARDPYLEEDLAAFPYMNGGLFKGDIEIPQLTDEILDLLLRKGSEEFDWSGISPVIFGAVFESTLNPETRRKGGMHYTSVANIHKVIDPLFLDDLKAELTEILGGSKAGFSLTQSSQSPQRNETATSRTSRTSRETSLRAFLDKLASLTFLDPACGSGNFLTETYLCLRRLENEALAALLGSQTVLDLDGSLVRVSIRQFHGVEINDFACRVAQTALWIAENQMLRETAALLHRNLDFLPLKTYDDIVEGNALRLDWAALRAARPDAEVVSDQSLVVSDPVQGISDQSLVVSSSSVLGTGDAGVPLTTNHSPLTTDYIIGNPPFVGYSLQDESQKADILDLYRDERGKPYKTAGKIDYVAGWYWKAAAYMAAHPATRTALVSTNSITQGEQVSSVWRPLVERFGIHIDFAHRTFRWDSESNAKAHVHCVIVGFSCAAGRRILPPAASAPPLPEGGLPCAAPPQTATSGRGLPSEARLGENARRPVLFDGERRIEVSHINPYLLPCPGVWIEPRRTPLCDVPAISNGSKPVDGGHFFLSPDEKSALLAAEPQAAPLLRRTIGAEEFINGKERWCLWLDGASPALLRTCPLVMDRVRAVRDFRLSSPKADTRKSAERPTVFQQIRQPATSYVVIPKVSSESRRYIPIAFLSPDFVPTDLIQFVPSATLYHFGVLTSNIHMAWMRAVAGRLKSDYRYSAQIVYNNFPWPEGSGGAGSGGAGGPPASAQTTAGEPPAPRQSPAIAPESHSCSAAGEPPAPRHIAAIERTAQGILDARARYPDSTLADLYDELTMPPDLRKAHQENDRAVMAAYGFSTKMTESECVAALFDRYRALAGKPVDNV